MQYKPNVKIFETKISGLVSLGCTGRDDISMQIAQVFTMVARSNMANQKVLLFGHNAIRA